MKTLFINSFFVIILLILSACGGTDSHSETPTNSSTEISKSGLIYKPVISPYTQRIWLDRNLGATASCTAIDDVNCYGDYYQWGRSDDGHQEKDSSLFITVNSSPYDWNVTDVNGTQRESEWKQVDGTSICPAEYRVPSKEELELEFNSSNISDTGKAFESFLKLPSAGYRGYANGTYVGEGSSSHLWSSEPSGNYATNYVNIFSNQVQWLGIEGRAAGFSVRCIKGNNTSIETPQDTDNNTSSDINATTVLTLTALDDEIEDELADALLTAQEAIALINVTENQFSMGTGANWRLDYYNMVKSYQQAVTKLDELIVVHEKMEALKAASSPKLTAALACDKTLDPYCLTDAENNKIDIYLDKFGETTPGGTKIDIKLIAQRTKQDISFISDLLQDKYRNIATKESREAAKWEYYTYVAQNISNGADIITAVAGVGTGIKILKGAVSAGLKRKATMTLFKNQLTKPANMSNKVYEVLKENYIKSWAKESRQLIVKTRADVLQGSWDLGGNMIGFYNTLVNMGTVPKSESLSNANSVIGYANAVMGVVNIAKTIQNPEGLRTVFVLKNPVTGKKDILFFSDSILDELADVNTGDLGNILKAGMSIVYDENGNPNFQFSDLTPEDKEQIKDKLNKESVEEALHEAEYEYLDENETEKTITSTTKIDFKHITEYHKNLIDNAENEFDVNDLNNSTKCPYGYNYVKEETNTTKVHKCIAEAKSDLVLYSYSNDGTIETENKYVLNELNGEIIRSQTFGKRHNLIEPDTLDFVKELEVVLSVINDSPRYVSIITKLIKYNLGTGCTLELPCTVIEDRIARSDKTGHYKSYITKLTQMKRQKYYDTIDAYESFVVNYETFENIDGSLSTCPTSSHLIKDNNGVYHSSETSKVYDKLKDNEGNYRCILLNSTETVLNENPINYIEYNEYTPVLNTTLNIVSAPLRYSEIGFRLYGSLSKSTYETLLNNLNGHYSAYLTSRKSINRDGDGVVTGSGSIVFSNTWNDSFSAYCTGIDINGNCIGSESGTVSNSFVILPK